MSVFWSKPSSPRKLPKWQHPISGSVSSDQGNDRRIRPAQSLDDLQRIDLVPRPRSKTMATLASNDIRETGGQVRGERRVSFQTPSTNVTICLDVYQPKTITTMPVPGIQVETGTSLRGSHTHVQATSDQRQASVQAYSQPSLHSQVSSLQPAQGSRHHLRQSPWMNTLIRRKDWQSAQLPTRSGEKTEDLTTNLLKR